MWRNDLLQNTLKGTITDVGERKMLRENAYEAAIKNLLDI